MTRNLYCLRDKISHDISNFFVADYDSQAQIITYDYFDKKFQESRHFDPTVYELLNVATFSSDCFNSFNPLVPTDSTAMVVELNYIPLGGAQ